MLVPSIVWLSTISKLKRRFHTMIKGTKSQLYVGYNGSMMLTALLVTILLATTYLLSTNFILGFSKPGIVVDTLILSRLYHPDMIRLDKKHNWNHMPLQMYGRHSLESYGYRLGEFKGSFSKDTDWQNWSQEMEDYCVQDVVVTTKLWQHFQKYLNGLS